MSDERINAIITAFEERIRELQAEGYKSSKDFQEDSLLYDFSSYLVQNCPLTKHCLEIFMQIVEFYPTILKDDVSLLDKIIKISEHENLEVNPYLLEIWERVDLIVSIQLILSRINELLPFAENNDLVESFEAKSGWIVNRVKEIIQAFAHWVDEELMSLAQTQNYYQELADLLSPFIHNPDRKLSSESFSEQITWFRNLTQHKYEDSPTGCYKEICYVLAKLDIELSTQHEWIPHPNKEFHTMFLIMTFLE
ncbi:MAG: hypothetical protein FK733_01075 [Asgard group archaeon]|nr:hypothetical protein [Asgard group archaeon]